MLPAVSRLTVRSAAGHRSDPANGANPADRDGQHDADRADGGVRQGRSGAGAHKPKHSAAGSGASKSPSKQGGRPARLGEALRASREALTDIQKQLEALLTAVRAPAGRPPVDAADRLRRASKRAGLAMNRLAAV